MRDELLHESEVSSGLKLQERLPAMTGSDPGDMSGVHKQTAVSLSK